MSQAKSQPQRFPYTSSDAITDPTFKLVMPDHALLTTARLQKGLTLQEVADKAKINIRHYQKLESGERSFRGTAFSLGLLICQILDLDPRQFL